MPAEPYGLQINLNVPLSSGDPSSHRQNNGTEDEPAAVQQAQHAEGGATHEQAQPPQHPKVHGSVRPRGSAACPHRVHKRWLTGAAHPEQVDRAAANLKDIAGERHRQWNGVPALEGRVPQGLD